MIDLILFDLDNTLYPESSGMGQEINHKMTDFVARIMDIDYAEASELKKANFKKYGTTLQWLVQEHGMGHVEEFMEAAHPKNIPDMINKDPDLKKMLSHLPQKKAILTNSPIEHAKRILQFLEIEEQFDNVFDIRINGFSGKPNLNAYNTPLQHFSEKPEKTLFIDDIVQYLEPFKAMGGFVLQINEAEKSLNMKKEIPAAPTIHWLEKYLQLLN